MREGGDTGDVARLDRLCRDKALAEIALAEQLLPGDRVVRGAGDELADVLLLKGEPGPDDLAALRALAGADGVAAGRALDALGLSAARFAVCTRVGDAGAPVRTERLRLITEAVDPRLVVALDPVAGTDFADAYGVVAPACGVLARVCGRRMLIVDGLEASLADEALKRRVWRQLRALNPAADTGKHSERP